MVTIKGAGRSDIKDLLTKSGVFDGHKLTHNPFLVFTVKPGSDSGDTLVDVILAKTPAELLAFPDDCEVMVQWPGQHRSDFFHFKVIDFKNFMEASINNTY